MDQRTGPVGRLVRVGGAIAVALTLASIVDPRGPARFRNPHILSEPSAWVLHGVMLLVLVVLIGTLASMIGDPKVARRAQILALLVLAALLALAGVVGQTTSGSAWGFPLADAVWTLDVAMLVQQFAAFTLAVALGTPGCEIGVWSELIARARREPASRSPGLACVVGLHLVDRWEARRRTTPR